MAPKHSSSRFSYPLRKFFFGRKGLGLWPALFIIVLVASLGGIREINEYADATLPPAILAMGATLRWWARKLALRKIPIPYFGRADRVEDTRNLLRAYGRLKGYR